MNGGRRDGPFSSRSGLTSCRQIPEVGELFVSTRSFANVRGVGVGVREQLCAGMTTDTDFVDDINVNYIPQLDELLRQRPTVFYGGEGAAKGDVYNNAPVSVYNTSNTVLNTKTDITVVPPLVRSTVAPINYGGRDYFPLETVEIETYRRDVNDLLSFVRLLAGFAGATDLPRTSVGNTKWLNLAVVKILNDPNDKMRGNGLWADMWKAAAESRGLTSHEEIVGCLLKHLSLYWWPFMGRRDGRPIPGTLSAREGFVTPIDTMAAIAEQAGKLSAIADGADIKKIAENADPVNAAAVIITAQMSLNARMEELVRHFKHVSPIYCGSISSSAASTVTRGEKMMIKLTHNAI